MEGKINVQFGTSLQPVTKPQSHLYAKKQVTLSNLIMLKKGSYIYLQQWDPISLSADKLYLKW